MVQLLNILYFLMELTFGRDASARRSRGQTIRAMGVLVLCGTSLYGNYWLLTERVKMSIATIALKKQMADYEAIKQENARLILKIATLEGIIVAIGTYESPPGSPSRQPRTPSDTVVQALPPRADVKPPQKDKEHINGR